MTQDIFLSIDGVAGESQDTHHAGDIEVTSWHWRIFQNSAMLSGPGGGAPRASVQDLIIVHPMDRSSPVLMTFCLVGRHIAQAVLTMRKAGGNPLDYVRITMNDVVISSVEPSTNAGGAYEQISLCFAKVRQEYVLQHHAGGSAGMVTGAFDLKSNMQL